MSEIRRVLRPDGRCVITYFLLNQEASHGVQLGLNAIHVPHVMNGGICRVASLEIPEMTVAYDENYVRALYMKNGIHITGISYGFWCGRKDIVGALQDFIVGIKGDEATA